MDFETIHVRKLNPHIGAEISGVDLTGPLSGHQEAEIHRAWMENLVIVFRDQALSVDQHLAFGRRFGELHVHPAAHLPDGHPEILVIKADETSRHVAGEEWHTDVSCDAEPPMGSLLHLTEVPPDGGGDTLFANMYLAFETLSAPIRSLLRSLTAIHDGKHVYERPGYRNDRAYPRSEHPVVRTHPVTGRQALFVNRGFTTRILGMSRPESDALLQMLFRHIETPEFSFRLHWAPNSLACWDNRCAQHHALFDYFPHRRYGHRVTVKGDKPFYRPEGEVPLRAVAAE